MPNNLIPVGRLSVATPASMAFCVRNPTEAQQAVDERIGGQVSPLVAAALADDHTVVDAAVGAVDASVAKGASIGLVGNTGFSTGPHLHWETWVNGTDINPRSFMAIYG